MAWIARAAVPGLSHYITQHQQRVDVQLCQMYVHGGVRHAHRGICGCGKVGRWPAAKAVEQPGSFDLGDHRPCFQARDRATAQKIFLRRAVPALLSSKDND